MEYWEKITAKKTYSYIKPHIESGIQSDIKLLDVGSGNGYLANLIRSGLEIKVTCIDVLDFCKTQNKPIIFDGRSMPFKENSFTTSICTFVLHHTGYQEQLLNEMKRVTSTKIIIIEDLPESVIDSFLTFFHKIFSRVVYKSYDMRFRKDSEWKEFFSELGLEVITEKRINGFRRSPFYPVARKLYVLSIR